MPKPKLLKGSGALTSRVVEVVVVRAVIECEVEVEEVKDAHGQALIRELIRRYHPLPLRGGGPFRYFALVERERRGILAVFVINPGDERVRQKARLPSPCYFVRRLLSVPPFQELNVLSVGLRLLCDYLKAQGVKSVYSFALPRHSGAVYRHAGWERGYTNPKGYTLWFKILR